MPRPNSKERAFLFSRSGEQDESSGAESYGLRANRGAAIIRDGCEKRFGMLRWPMTWSAWKRTDPSRHPTAAPASLALLPSGTPRRLRNLARLLAGSIAPRLAPSEPAVPHHRRMPGSQRDFMRASAGFSHRNSHFLHDSAGSSDVGRDCFQQLPGFESQI